MITDVEIHYLACRPDGSIEAVILMLTHDDGSQETREVAIG